MTTNELISIKLQEILGGAYLVKPFSLFSREYIKPLQTVYGTTYDINYQAFEEMQNTIPVCVNLQETSPINSTDFYRTGIITIQFFVPVDCIGSNKSVNFFEDYGRLRAQLTKGRVPLITYKTDGTPIAGQDEVENIYKSYFTLNEPTTDGAIHGTGVYRRMTFTVQGNVTVLEEGLRTGDDYTFEIFDGSKYVPFNNITNVVISRDEQGNAVQNEGTTAAMSPPVSRVHSASFIVTDKKGDDAIDILRSAVFEMKEKYVDYNSLLTESQEREVKIRLKTDGTVLSEFWAIMSASYNVGGKTSVGTYSVSLIRTDDLNQKMRRR